MDVIACLACSIDGKITAPGLPDGKGFGSPSDMNRLKALRDSADALLIGAETFRNYPKPRKGLSRSAVPKQYILTRSGGLDPHAPLFSGESDTHAVIYASGPAPDRWPLTVAWRQFDDATNPVPQILAEVAADGVKTLLIEGGGQVMNLFLRAKALHRLHLTLCPFVVGGTQVPSLVSGQPFTWGDLPTFETLDLVQNGDELFWDLKLV
jgi:5-amino-6-(5-phosphoribosylamino)uracil reductase